MAYKFSFADNEIYSASDVNEITKRLVTAGIEDSFTDGVAYNVSKFNEAGQLLYTSGVVPEGCHTLKVSKISDTEILINPGLAFFNDGAVIEIEPGGETLSFVSGVKNYVYLKNELIDKNICYPVCTTEAPTGDYVLLAEIDENAVIKDMRTYAKGKLPGYQSVAGNVLVIDETAETPPLEGELAKIISGNAVFDIGNNNYKYIIVVHPHQITENYRTYHQCIGIYNIETKTYFCFYRYYDESYFTDKKIRRFYHRTLNNHDYYDDMTFELENGKLTVNYDIIYADSGQFRTGTTTEIAIKLFLF